MNKNIGKLGEDIITGFKGTIIGYVEYQTGCNQYLIVPRCKEGEENKKPEGHWIDDNRIQIAEGEEIKLKKTYSSGPDISPHT